MIASRTLRRVGASMVASILSGAALAGCSPDRVGTAALVGDDTISTETLQDNARDYLEVVPDADTATLQQKILNTLILSTVIAKVANENDVTISDAAVARQRRYIYSQTRGRDGLIKYLGAQQNLVLPPRYVDQWVRDQLTLSGILRAVAGSDAPDSEAAQQREQAALARAGKQLDIRVNPRYGRWDENRGVRSLPSGGLAFSSAQLTK